MSSTAACALSAFEYTQLRPFRPKVSAAWDVFVAHVVELQSAFRETLTFSDHVVNLRISGTLRSRIDANGQTHVGRSGPGTLQVIPANLTTKWETAVPSGGSRTIAMFVPEAFLARIAEECGMDSRKIEMIPQFFIHDPLLEGVLTRLAIEAQSGSPSGPLYAESACEFLAHHLIQTYSTRSRPLSRASGGLSGHRLRAVLDYIDESLTHPITLRELAEVAQVSPRHFERAFRQAVGTPPHAYVTERRVAAARDLLVSEPALTIDRIASSVGFSSSSHLALAFRRQTGCSPAAFRRLHAR